MKIIINGREESIDFEGDTLGHAFAEIKKHPSSTEKIISQLRLNDKEISWDTKENLETPLSDTDTIEVEFSTLNEIILKNINNAEHYLQKLIPGIEKAAELFQTENEQDANKYFLIIIDGIDWFSQVLDGVMKAAGLDPSSIELKGETLQNRKNHLIDLMGKMLDANQNKDWVLMADLLEYEIAPYYKEWTQLIPEFRDMILNKIP
ncbi:MAG: hypothetical protein ACE5EK_03445 [Nitrospinales bacterium]